jgi:transposase InsO family protein
MGRVGTSYDNAPAEAFFATLERELPVHHQTWTSDANARRDVFRWIAFHTTATRCPRPGEAHGR